MCIVHSTLCTAIYELLSVYCPVKIQFLTTILQKKLNWKKHKLEKQNNK